MTTAPLTGFGLGFLVAAQVGPVWLLAARSVIAGRLITEIMIGARRPSTWPMAPWGWPAPPACCASPVFASAWDCSARRCSPLSVPWRCATPPEPAARQHHPRRSPRPPALPPGARRHPGRAALLAGAVEELRRRPGLRVWPTLRRGEAGMVAEIQHALGTDQFDQAFSAGAGLTQRDAVAIVRDQRGTSTQASVVSGSRITFTTLT